MHHSLKNTFQSQKVIHWTQRMIKKLLSLIKNSYHNFTLSLLGQNAVWTKNTSGKQNLKKTNIHLRVVKNHDVPNNSPYRFAAIKKLNEPQNPQKPKILVKTSIKWIRTQ